MLPALLLALPTAVVATSSLFAAAKLVEVPLNLHLARRRLERHLEMAQKRALRNRKHPTPLRSWEESSRRGREGARDAYVEFGIGDTELLVTGLEQARIAELLSGTGRFQEELIGLLHYIVGDQGRRAKIVNMGVEA